eukprot:COSAG01_NODE_69374_length_261_cov_1.253086_1_plen_60_part_01
MATQQLVVLTHRLRRRDHCLGVRVVPASAFHWAMVVVLAAAAAISTRAHCTTKQASGCSQ